MATCPICHSESLAYNNLEDVTECILCGYESPKLGDYKIDGAGGVNRFIDEHKDTGCEYSTKCARCPFSQCLDGMSKKEKQKEINKVIKRLKV